MHDSVLYIIRWESRSSKSYLYGTDLRYLPNGTVQMKNSLLPPGAVINEWNSHTNFQRDLYEPNLPLLKAGHSYCFEAHFSETPADTVLLRFEFFDHLKRRLDFLVFDGKSGRFTLPEGTYSYTLQLIQGGSRELVFDHIALTEAEDGIFREICNKEGNIRELNLILPRAFGSVLHIPAECRKYPNSIGMSPEIFRGPRGEQEDMIGKLTSGYDVVHFRNASRRDSVTIARMIRLIQKTNPLMWFMINGVAYDR